MLLLTWHGTIVCIREGGLTRYGRFLCAEQGNPQMAFARPAASVWETFLPIGKPDLDRLAHLAAGRWVVPQSRELLHRGAVGPAKEFKLAVGSERLPMADCLPFPASPGGHERITIPAGSRVIELALAGPRRSALLTLERWPVRARRTAETLALAARRQLTGREPEQDEFERDVGFLLDREGPDGLEDLIERITEGLSVREAPAEAAAKPPLPITQPVIPLGTACIVACTLRRMNLHQPPMPFDWLATTPAMIRHCLETDFSVLLDQTQYRSLTGQARPGEPDDGCAHEYYAREHGIGRVFNHNDPTREADYRYTQACIDRLRDVLASDRPKLFVQVREAGPNTRADFEATAALLGRLTRNGSLLQVAVSQPDRRQALPMLNVVLERGSSALYRLHPVSPMGGEAFSNAADADLLASLITAHASRAEPGRLVAGGDRAAVQAAAVRFGSLHPPGPVLEDEAMQQATLDLANQSLNRFVEAVGLPKKYRFAGLDPAKLPGKRTSEAFLAQINGQQATLRVPLGQKGLWVRLHRSLALIYLFDLILADGPMPDTRFLAELGDAGYEDRSANFCSNKPGSCLLPDSDFFASGGYDTHRRQVAASPVAWNSRRPVVFWRGSTTGQRRRAAPGEGQEDDFTWLPRLDLCHRALVSALSQHYDVGLSNTCQIDDPHVLARIERAGLRKAPVSRTGFLGHKAILVIDGNSNAWSALFCALLTGACVLKVESPKSFRQWYYDGLQPWVHFVPVSEDLHDLDERTAWLFAHDGEARGIAQAGQDFAQAMTFESVMGDAAMRLRKWIADGPGS